MAATCKARESWDSALWKGLVFFAKQLHNLVIQLQGISFRVRCKSNQGKQHRSTAQDNITNNISKNRHTTHCLQTKRHALERTKTKTRSVAPSWIYTVTCRNFPCSLLWTTGLIRNASDAIFAGPFTILFLMQQYVCFHIEPIHAFLATTAVSLSGCLAWYEQWMSGLTSRSLLNTGA